MAIKKREPIDQARLEAFAAGADTPAVQPATVTPRPVAAVSYTHLTLPTIYSV